MKHFERDEMLIERGIERGIKRGIERGIERGETFKLIEMICRKLKKGKSVTDIADELEENIAEVQRIADVATRFAPDYDVEAIYGELEKVEV